MYVHIICTYIHIHIYTYIYVYIICTYIHIHIYTYIYIYILYIYRLYRCRLFIFYQEPLKFLSCLRLDLTHLKEHRSGHNFQDCINQLCSCCLEIEDTSHYLLHCHRFYG